MSNIEYFGDSDLLYLLNLMKTEYDKYVKAVEGKGLSTNDFTNALKTKLEGIATGAEVNQNAFSNVKVGATTIAADGKTDTLELIAGNNVSLTPDASGDSVTINAQDTTYSEATTSNAGLMSASDKTKLNGVASGAEVNQNAFSNVKVGNATLAADSKTDTFELVAGNNVTLTPDESTDKVTITAQDTTYNNATTSAAGLMSATDKSKLDGIASGAEVNVQANWTQTNSGSDDYIKNKPTLGTAAAKNYTDSYSATGTDLVTGKAIAAALGTITGISFQSYNSFADLPATGQVGVIYLVPNSGSSPNVKDEYFWNATTSSYELFGTTEVDLTNYVQFTDLVELTEAEVTAAWNSVFGS